MKTLRYSLGRLQGICPSCHRRTFKFYIDSLTGRPLHHSCGRCNREVKCRYHLRPSQLGLHNRPVVGGFVAENHRQPAKPSFVSGYVMASCCRRVEDDPLFRYMVSMAPEEIVRRAFERCLTRHTQLMRSATLFALMDAQGRFRSAKVIAYGSDGHRLKNRRGVPPVGYLHSLLRLPLFVYEGCYFCSHLATDYPEATLLMVESEKTALMLNMMIDWSGQWGRYVALASGGASALRHDPAMRGRETYRTAVLRRRRVVLLPDADMVERWQADGATLRDVCKEVRLVDVRRAPYCLSGSMDMADYIEKLLKSLSHSIC